MTLKIGNLLQRVLERLCRVSYLAKAPLAEYHTQRSTASPGMISNEEQLCRVSYPAKHSLAGYDIQRRTAMSGIIPGEAELRWYNLSKKLLCRV